MIEIKIDPRTLPKDGQKVRWQTQDDIDEREFKEGEYSEPDGLFLYNQIEPEEFSNWDTVYDVHHWELIDE